MTFSIPGVLVSRDGTVREYVGHSERTGTLFGTVARDEVWTAVCEGCGTRFMRLYQGDAVRALRDHWRNADASMGASHVWKTR